MKARILKWARARAPHFMAARDEDALPINGYLLREDMK